MAGNATAPVASNELTSHLRRVDEVDNAGETTLAAGTGLFDPKSPFSLKNIWRRIFG